MSLPGSHLTKRLNFEGQLQGIHSPGDGINGYHVQAMLELQKRGSFVFDYGNIRAQAHQAG
jgi:urocanate hydratase